MGRGMAPFRLIGYALAYSATLDTTSDFKRGSLKGEKGKAVKGLAGILNSKSLRQILSPSIPQPHSINLIMANPSRYHKMTFKASLLNPIRDIRKPKTSNSATKNKFDATQL
jgi:hypothetical protein